MRGPGLSAPPPPPPLTPPLVLSNPLPPPYDQCLNSSLLDETFALEKVSETIESRHTPRHSLFNLCKVCSAISYIMCLVVCVYNNPVNHCTTSNQHVVFIDGKYRNENVGHKTYRLVLNMKINHCVFIVLSSAQSPGSPH